MGEQNFTFDVEFQTKTIDEIMEAVASNLKTRIERETGLFWNPDTGLLAGEKTVRVPEYLDLDDELAVESTQSMANESIEQDTSGLIESVICAAQ
ncbi:MAG TPA: hypothetical protein VKA31_05640 [Mariprofundaceae bacterium]|nr:hypothetical protein [Mariprofundaceae bacterium]